VSLRTRCSAAAESPWRFALVSASCRQVVEVPFYLEVDVKPARAEAVTSGWCSRFHGHSLCCR
jgi:hypothetical protein